MMRVMCPEERNAGGISNRPVIKRIELIFVIFQS